MGKKILFSGGAIEEKEFAKLNKGLHEMADEAAQGKLVHLYDGESNVFLPDTFVTRAVAAMGGFGVLEGESNAHGAAHQMTQESVFRSQ